MLKIKDNIDLKELEKYGLKYFSNDDERICCYIQDNEEWFPSGLMVDKDTREIKLHSSDYEFGKSRWTGKHSTNLYDLIKDGLVEKVDDE